MSQQPHSPATHEYHKIPNVPGLYRHVKSGRYHGVKKVNGKRKERSLGTTDRKIAERRLQEWVSKLGKVDTEVEKTKLSQLTASLLAVNQGKSESTVYIAQSVCDDFRSFLSGKLKPDPEVGSIRPSHVEEWLAVMGQGIRNTSYNRYAGVVKQLLELAVKDRIIAESPFAQVNCKSKRPQDVMRNAPTVKEFEAIIEEVRREERSRFHRESADFLEFLGLAGVGQAEASSLVWGDVNLHKGEIFFRRHKTDRRFRVPIYDFLRPLLERLKNEAGANVSPDQKVLKISDGKKALTNACKRLGLPHFSQRNLRQCLIKRLAAANISVKHISKWQGHQDGGKLIMDTYTEVFCSDDDQYEAQQLAKLSVTGAPTNVTSPPAIAA